MVLRSAPALRGALEGVGPENRDFFGPWNGTLVPFQGPKKSRFSGPTPSNAPCNVVALLKTINYKRLKNNWYIGSFMYPSAVVCCCVLLCAVVCCCVLLCAVVCCCVLLCAVVYCCVLLCTVVYCCVLLCTVVFCCVLLCSVVFCCVLLCSVVFCCVLFCTVVVCCWVLLCVVAC